VGEDLMEEASVAEINAGGRTSTGGDGELDWGTREPADSNGYTNKFTNTKRKRTGGVEELRQRRKSSGGGNGAAAGAPTRWQKRLGHGEACELGFERRGSAVESWGCLNRLGGAPGGGSPAAMAINGRLEGV
jgi:hypothetical protein